MDIKKLLLGLIVLLTGAPQAFANRTDGIKDRDFYQAKDAKNGFGTIIQITADMPTYKVNIVSSQGVYYTVLALFANKDADGYDGYVAAGQYDETKDKNDNYLATSFATNGYFDRTDIYYEDGNHEEIKELFIPSSITLKYPYYSGDDALKDKKFKVVGVDFGAFANLNVLRFVLPSSVTYIGTCAFRQSGPGKDNSNGGIDFWDGVNYESNRSYDGNEAEWKELNNIEAIAQKSFYDGYFQHFHKMFNPNKLQTLGPTTSNQGEDNGCFYNGCLNKLDLSTFTNITEIPTGAFHRNQNYLTSVVLGEGITQIHARAFKECKVLETATLSCPNLTLLGVEAFAECAKGTFSTPTDGLTSVDLTGCTSLTTLSKKAFYQCYRLSTLKLPESITTIGEMCFQENGFTGRFDIPDHITSIEDKAFYRCKISYLPIEDREYSLSVGKEAFCPTNHLTVDLSSTTTVPDITATSGRPFDVYNTSRTSYKLRIIVPIGKAETYVANKTGIGYLYKHHEYRVKFDSPTYENKATWTNPKTDEQETAPWWVGSASWDNDIYTFKPYHGGTVDTWTSVTSTNQEGETKDLYTAAIDYYYKNDGNTDNPKMGDFVAGTSSEPSIVPRTAHKYYSNYGTGETIDIPKIGTVEVEDGIVPPGVGILLTYTKQGTFLVPPLDDWVEEKELTSVGVIRNKVLVDNISSIDTKRLYAGSGDAPDYTDATLDGIKGGKWIDVEEELAKVRVMRVYDDAGTTSTVKAVDLAGTFNFGSLTEVKHWYDASNSQTIPFVHGQEIDLDATCANGQKKYVFDTSKDNKEADYLYMEYTVDGDFDFFSAYANPDSYIATKLTATGEGLGGRVGYQKEWASAPRYWYNLFSLSGKETGTGKFVEANRDYAANHKDNGNILVPVTESRVVWPFYMDVDEDTYNRRKEEIKDEYKVADTGYYHYQVDGVWQEPELKYLIGGTNDERLKLEKGSSGFISFGMSQGYFVGTTKPGMMKANKAFMRVHLSELHPDAHSSESPGSAKIAIVDMSVHEEQGGTVTGIENSSEFIMHSSDNAVYDLFGRKVMDNLNSELLKPGIYLHGGKKVVIR